MCIRDRYTIQDFLSAYDEGTLPTEFRMHPNYPNPFNPKTTIKFELPKSEYVRLVIMDLLGRNIKTLAKGEVRAGYHDVEWDGTMDSGSLVPSGVYLIVFDSNNYKKSYKALLIK